MNKKIIYLILFLIIGLFLISACSQTIGRKLIQDQLPVPNISDWNPKPSLTWQCTCGGGSYESVDDISGWVKTCHSSYMGCHS